VHSIIVENAQERSLALRLRKKRNAQYPENVPGLFDLFVRQLPSFSQERSRKLRLGGVHWLPAFIDGPLDCMFPGDARTPLSSAKPKFVIREDEHVGACQHLKLIA
jgi:hypothetical protein